MEYAFGDAVTLANEDRGEKKTLTAPPNGRWNSSGLRYRRFSAIFREDSLEPEQFVLDYRVSHDPKTGGLAPLSIAPSTVATRSVTITLQNQPGGITVKSGDLLAEVLASLAEKPKRLPSKLFYDRRGSELFEQICRLPEYYLTRAEIEILETHGPAIAAQVGPYCMLVEFGAGSITKTRILLDHLQEPTCFVPVDISGEFLMAAAAELGRDYPNLSVYPVAADYLGKFELPTPPPRTRLIVGVFLGSTIGNLEMDEAVAFLNNVRGLIGRQGRLLLGIDLRKDPEVLWAAYNDAEGVTAKFNLNILEVVNRELGADFNSALFAHYAEYFEQEGRIEMRLVSREDQQVAIGERTINLAEGEFIVTEYSHKYRMEDVERLARGAGMTVERVWTDRRRLFSLQLLRVAD